MKRFGIYGHFNPLFLKALNMPLENAVLIPSIPREFSEQAIPKGYEKELAGVPSSYNFGAALYALTKSVFNPPRSKKEALLRYQAEFIRAHNLDLVLTFVDTRVPYYELANMVPEVDFYAFQNGIRLNLFELMFKDHSYSTRVKYICFGEKDRESILNTNVKFRDIHIVGSILADYAWEEMDSAEDVYDLCLVSQWRQCLFEEPKIVDFDLGGFESGYEILLSHINRLRRELPVRFSIAGGSVENPLELAYFQKRLEPGFDFFYRSEKTPVSYGVTKKSKVCVGFNSSCIYEAFAHGKRPLICDFYEYTPHHYSDKKNATWVVKSDETSYEIFREKYLRIHSLSEKEFQEEALPIARKRIFYDPTKPAHREVRKIIGIENQRATPTLILEN